MNKTDIANLLVLRHPKLKQTRAKKIVDSIFRTLSNALASGQRIEIRSFGSFSLKIRKVGTVNNPKCGIFTDPCDRQVVYFRPAQKLAKRVNLSKNL